MNEETQDLVKLVLDRVDRALSALDRIAVAVEALAQTQDGIFECQRSSVAASKEAMARVEAIRGARV